MDFFLKPAEQSYELIDSGPGALMSAPRIMIATEDILSGLVSFPMIYAAACESIEKNAESYQLAMQAQIDGNKPLPLCEYIRRKRVRTLSRLREIGDIYVIRYPSVGYKIGKSANSKQRLRNYPGAELVLLYKNIAGYHFWETRLHQMFDEKKSKIKNQMEWFDLENADIEKIVQALAKVKQR